jgi:hypothetical protein
MEMKQAMISDHNRIKFEIRHKKPLWKISKCLEMTQNNSQCIKKKKREERGREELQNNIPHTQRGRKPFTEQNESINI